MINLDHNATTPIAPEVLAAMRPYLEREFGNPSSAHADLAHLGDTLNVSFRGRHGADLLARAPSLAASTGSACHAGSTEPSAVLSAMGLDAAEALGPSASASATTRRPRRSTPRPRH